MGVVDLLLPVRCAVCARAGPELCRACTAALPRLRPPLCERCGAPTAWPVVRCRECAGRRLAFASARAAVAYDARVRALVSAWKERGRRRLAAIVADVVAEGMRAPPADALVAVPADRERTLTRGHRPAPALARELAARWQLPLLPALERTRPGPRQRGASLAARRRNVAGAFRARGDVPARVALVDDVYTTGATAAAASSALRAAGVRRVDVVTFARALRSG